MKKRIYVSMMRLTVVSLLLVSAALCFVFYGQFSENVRNEIRERAWIFKNADSQTVMQELVAFKPADMRLTLIDREGIVKHDNTVSAAGLENHADRKEVKEAFQTGFGESTRFSDTLRQKTYYFSVRLADGSVLRVSKTTDSILGMFGGALFPVICVVLAVIIIGYFLAGNLTQRIVEPINGVDLNVGLAAPYDELVPFVRTIDEQRKHIARQLLDLKNRTDTISAIMDNMCEGIILVNKQGVILSVNKSAAAIFAIGVSMNGKSVLEMIRDVEFLENMRSALAGSRGEMSIERSDRTYRVIFSPVTDSGAIILFLDITEKMMAEKMRREFSANVSHELKTPLTSIYGHAEMLYNNIVKESDKREFFRKIKDEAARLIALIEDIIMISKLDEGKGYELFEEVDIASVIAETTDALSLIASENMVSVNVSGQGVFISANRSMMHELFYNLIDNAIKYNKPGGSVRIEIEMTGKKARISIADTGVGIPIEDQSRVFERFYRVDKSRSRKTGGTGLGLAIAKHIVTAHGGTIELKSRKGEGTIIEIVLGRVHINRNT